MRITSALLATLVVLTCAGSTFAADWPPSEPAALQSIVQTLLPRVQMIGDAQVRIEPDVQNANAVQQGQASLIVVPQRNIDLASKSSQNDPGTPLGHLFFLGGAVPAVDGKPIDKSKLRMLSVALPDGSQREVGYVAMAARQLENGAWNLYAYGSQPQPALKVEFGEETESTADPLTVRVLNFDGKQGTVAITVFGENRADFGVAVP